VPGAGRRKSWRKKQGLTTGTESGQGQGPARRLERDSNGHGRATGNCYEHNRIKELRSVFFMRRQWS